MSALLLIRHGQAAAYEPDSDRLTEIGERQARRVGEALAREGALPVRMVSGSLVRQRRTLELASEVLASHGVSMPVAVIDPRWNEYDAPGILDGLLPALAKSEASFAALVAEFQANAASPERNRYFQRMFEVLMETWRRGLVAAPGVEAFGTFHARVRQALDELTNEGGRGTTIVFTSGGPIGVCAQLATGAPDAAALTLNFRVKNGSLTELVFSKGRLSLDGFNAVGHIEPELRTFR
jgi:broad specificity phosphatase PhoE